MMHHQKTTHTPDAIVVRLWSLVDGQSAGGQRKTAAGLDTKLPQHWQARCIGRNSVAVLPTQPGLVARMHVLVEWL